MLQCVPTCRSLEMGRDLPLPLETCYFPTFVTVQIWSLRIKGYARTIGVTKIWGRWGPAPQDGAVADPVNIRPCHLAKCGRRPSGTSVITEIRRKNLTSLTFRLSRSLKVVGTDTDRSATYDVLTIHSNDGPISCRFRDKWRKWQIFPPPCF